MTGTIFACRLVPFYQFLVTDKYLKQQKESYEVNNSYPIWIAVTMLCIFGAIMVYSASAYEYAGTKVGSAYLLKKQLALALCGLAACFILQFFPYRLLYKLCPIIYLVGVGTIFLLLSSFGHNSKGATRWLEIGSFSVQVAEIVKISVIVFCASMIERFQKNLHRNVLALYIWIGGFGAALLLLLISNDLSSSLVILGITFGLTFIFTQTLPLHLGVAALGVTFVVFYVWSIWTNLPTPDEMEGLRFRERRIAAWLSPETYMDSQSYQTMQGLYAIGSGGIFGKGLGNSTQKLSAIPEGQNDMLFSIVCEELGVVGGALLIFMIGYLLYYMVKIARASHDLLGSALVCGCFFHISLQSIINIAVNLNVFPNTGIGLPFISYGGTAILCQLLEIAIVLSVERKNRLRPAPTNRPRAAVSKRKTK